MKFMTEKDFDNFVSDPNQPLMSNEKIDDELEVERESSSTGASVSTQHSVYSSNSSSNAELLVDNMSSSSSVVEEVESANQTPPNEIDFYRQACSPDCPNHFRKTFVDKFNRPIINPNNNSHRSLSDIFGRTFISGTNLCFNLIKRFF